jgi:hypothetical protein
MKVKSSMLLNIILLTILSASFFLVNTTASVNKYDPWLDIDDDGKIDITDIFMIAQLYGGTGDPINKTALLYEVNATFTELLSRIDGLNTTLNSRIDDLETQIDEMNATIIQMNSTITNLLNATKLGKPDYDSGWTPIELDEHMMFEHNLDTTNVLVYMIGKYSDSASPYIHQIAYGGDYSGLEPNFIGASWYDLTNMSIWVHRRMHGGTWNEVRVMIWKIPSS